MVQKDLVAQLNNETRKAIFKEELWKMVREDAEQYLDSEEYRFFKDDATFSAAVADWVIKNFDYDLSYISNIESGLESVKEDRITYDPETRRDYERYCNR